MDFLFVFHIHASRKKSSLKMQWAWIPKCLPSFYFIFLRESLLLFFLFFTKGFFFLIFIIHQIFIILAKLKQGQDKTARIIEAFSQNTHFEFFKAKSASFESCANFIIWNASEPCLISSTNLRTFSNKFEKFLAGVCPKRYASQSLR